jgi:glycosyltransferase involved in cell wall biosynthesis
MKIGIFTNNFRPFVGGVTRSIETFAREFDKKGHEVHIFAPRFEGYKKDEKAVYRVPAIPRFNHTDFSLPLPFSLKVRSIFDKLELDLVHVQHPFFLGEMGMHLGKNRGLPIILTYHTQYEKYSHYAPIDSDLVKRWIVNVCTSFCNLCDLVVAPSEDIRNLLISRDVKTRIEVIPTGVDFELYKNPDRQWFRREFGIDEGKKVLVHVGRLAKEKNLDFLFRSVAVVMKKNKEVLLFIAGEGDQKERLRNLAGQLGIQDQVLFHGKMTSDELVNAYAGGDLFVFSSKTETQGLVVLEAMAAGMPVVAVDAPGLRDVVADGVCGFLTSEDPQDFSEKILFLIQSADKKETFSRASLKIARQFSSSKMADRMLKEYSHLLQQSPDTLNPEIHRFKILKGLLQEALR